MATVLERLAQKKSSNVKIFEEIQKTLTKEFQARKMEVKETESTSAAILFLIYRQASSAKHQGTSRIIRVTRKVYVNKY